MMKVSMLSRPELFDILNPAITEAESYSISNKNYLELFGIKDVSTVQNVWKHLYELAKPQIHESHYEAIDVILTEGTLSTRILKAMGNDYSEQHIRKVYSELAQCLEENNMFVS